MHVFQHWHMMLYRSIAAYTSYHFNISIAALNFEMSFDVGAIFDISSCVGF